MRKACLILLTLLAFSVATGYGAVYYWTGSTDLSWSTAANWSPVRSVGTTGDTLIFTADSTVHDTVVGGSTETVASIIIMPATAIWFQTASGKRTLSINDSLTVPAGSSLSVISPTAAADTLVIYLNTGARASIDGNIAFNYFTTTTGPRHRLDAADSLAIQFNAGSVVTQNTIGNMFGSTGGANRVIFHTGSQFIQYLGSNPFGLGQPASKVLFEPGSWFRFRQSGSPSFSGRTYANFQLDWPTFSANATGTSPTSIDTLLITDGRLSLQLRHINIKGAVVVLDTLYFNSATTCSLFFNGSTQQTMDWSTANSFMLGTATNVFVDNPNGLLLNSNFVVNCKLHLVNGQVVTGSNQVSVTTDSTIVRNNGYVNGTLWRTINSGTGVAKDYPVGNDAGYTPANFTFANVSVSGGASVTTVHNTHPDAAIPANTMKNYWSVGTTGGLVFDTCSAILGYLSGDFNTGFSETTDEENMVAGKYDTSVWSIPPVTARDTLNNIIQISEITGFSDFALGKDQEAFLGDMTPPTIVSTSPATGDSGVVLDAPLVIAFSEPMDTASIDGTSTPDVPNAYKTWNATMDTMSLVHDMFDVNTTYTFVLTAGKDLAGNDLSNIPDTVIFTTVVDTSHPYIVYLSPADGDSNVALNEPVVLAFSEPIDPATFGGYNLPDISVTLSWNPTYDTLTLTPDTLYDYGTTYTFYDTAGADIYGNEIVGLPVSFSFTTIYNRSPIISIVEQPGDTYDGSGPFLVRAVMTDPAKSGITADTLWYTDNINDWQFVTHSTVSADTYNFEIPGAFPAGTAIEYFVGAWDDVGAYNYEPTYLKGYLFRILDPLPPSGLTAVAGNQTVALNWAPPAQVLSYCSDPYWIYGMPATSIVSTRFTPMHYPCKIEQATSLWYNDVGVDSLVVHVYADDGSGYPDESSELVTPFKIMPAVFPNFTTIDLSSYDLVLTSGDFHVGYEQVTAERPNVVYDDVPAKSIRSLYKWDDGYWYTDLGTNWNHEAVVSYSIYSGKGLALPTAVINSKSAKTRSIPFKPAIITAKGEIGYDRVEGALYLAKNISGYEVLRGDVTGGPYTTLGPASDTAFIDNTVINDNTYYYVVRASYSSPDTFSGYSNEANATPTGVEGKPDVQPYALRLSPVTPNPINHGTASFKFSLPEAAPARLDIFNVLGQKITTLVDGKFNAGEHSVNWNITDRSGNKLSSGVYIYQLSAMGRTFTKRLTVIK